MVKYYAIHIHINVINALKILVIDISMCYIIYAEYVSNNNLNNECIIFIQDIK